MKKQERVHFTRSWRWIFFSVIAGLPVEGGSLGMGGTLQKFQDGPAGIVRVQEPASGKYYSKQIEFFRFLQSLNASVNPHFAVNIANMCTHRCGREVKFDSDFGHIQ